MDYTKFQYGLLKSGEEGAELAQAVLKSVTHADEAEFVDGNMFFEKLVEEFGDAMASIDFTFDNADQHFRFRVAQRMADKYDKYAKRFEN